MTGARFMVYKGMGARLERAMINFMLDFTPPSTVILKFCRRLW